MFSFHRREYMESAAFLIAIPRYRLTGWSMMQRGCISVNCMMATAVKDGHLILSWNVKLRTAYGY